MDEVAACRHRTVNRLTSACFKIPKLSRHDGLLSSRNHGRVTLTARGRDQSENFGSKSWQRAEILKVPGSR